MKKPLSENISRKIFYLAALLFSIFFLYSVSSQALAWENSEGQSNTLGLGGGNQVGQHPSNWGSGGAYVNGPTSSGSTSSGNNTNNSSGGNTGNQAPGCNACGGGGYQTPSASYPTPGGSCPAGQTSHCSIQNQGTANEKTVCSCIYPTPAVASTYTISGLVFDDQNGDRVKQSGEPGSDGTQTVIRLYNPTTGALIPNKGATVASNGTWSISAVSQGRYNIRAITWAPYTLTYPNVGSIPGQYPNYNVVSNASGLNFGIHQSSATPPPATPPPGYAYPTPPDISFQSIACSGSEIYLGEDVAIDWTCTPSGSCTANFNLTGGSPVTVTPSTGGLNTYWIKNSYGTQDQCSVNVLVPDLNLSADNPSVRRGETTNLRWDATNVDSCTLSGPGVNTSCADTDSCASSHVTDTGPLEAESKYTLVCQTPTGPVSRFITVHIQPEFNEQ